MSLLDRMSEEAGRSGAEKIFLRLVTPERTRGIVSIDELGEESGNPAELKGLIDRIREQGRNVE